MNAALRSTLRRIATSVTAIAFMSGCGGRPPASKNMSPIVEDDPAVVQQIEELEKKRLEELAEQHRLAKERKQLPNLPPELLPGGAPPRK